MNVVAQHAVKAFGHDAHALTRRHQPQRNLQFAHFDNALRLERAVGKDAQHLIGEARARGLRKYNQRLFCQINQIQRATALGKRVALRQRHHQLFMAQNNAPHQ